MGRIHTDTKNNTNRNKKVNTDASENDIIKIANECELNKTKGRKIYKDYYTAQIYTKKR